MALVMAMDLASVAVGLGVIRSHQEYSDLVVGALISCLGIGASSVLFRASQDASPAPSDPFVRVAIQGMAALLLVTGLVVCALTPTTSGIKLGGGIALYASINVVAVERAFRILRRQER